MFSSFIWDATSTIFWILECSSFGSYFWTFWSLPDLDSLFVCQLYAILIIVALEYICLNIWQDCSLFINFIFRFVLASLSCWFFHMNFRMCSFNANLPHTISKPFFEILMGLSMNLEVINILMMLNLSLRHNMSFKSFFSDALECFKVLCTFLAKFIAWYFTFYLVVIKNEVFYYVL